MEKLWHKIKTGNFEMTDLPISVQSDAILVGLLSILRKGATYFLVINLMLVILWLNKLTVFYLVLQVFLIFTLYRFEKKTLSNLESKILEILDL